MNYPYTPQPLLISATTIKTINGDSILGSGDISLVAPDDLLSLRPVITRQPRRAYFASGGTATFSIAAATVANTHITLSYQWQTSGDGGVTWSNIVGATSSTYTTGTLSLTDRYKPYRCIVSNAFGSETSSSVDLDLYLLDEYNIAAVAYGLRKLKSSYTGPLVTVQRILGLNASSIITAGIRDFTEDEILNGDLAEWVGPGNTGTVLMWYDQIGSNNAIQATTANQPRIVYDGQVLTDTKGNPSVYFLDGSTGEVQRRLELTNYYAASQANVSAFYAFDCGTTGYAVLLGSDPDQRGFYTLISGGAMITAAVRSAPVFGSGGSISTNRPYLRYDTANRTTLATYLNGSASPTISIADGNTDFSMPTKTWLGNANFASILSQTYMPFFIGCTSDVSSVQQAFRERLMADYDIDA